MNPFRNLATWLDIRPNEGRSLALSVMGAFMVLAFMILARSLREALYLTSFDIKTLPYITAAVALLSLPAVDGFTRLLGRYPPRIVLRMLVLISIVGLLLLLPFVEHSRVALVIFYLWTAIVTLLLTSGFWVVISEQFAVRGAKRLFGLIGAGGTAGAIVTGFSLAWMAERINLIWFTPLLIGFLVLFFLALRFLPESKSEAKVDSSGESVTKERLPARRNLGLIWNTPHLRTIALIIFIATMASTLVDYQFKELARSSFAGEGQEEKLTGFLGAFYGWTGGIALVIQLVGTTRIMAAGGVGAGLAVLPVFLLLGSAGLLIAPVLWLATLVRGADNSLRKSVHRPLLEFLYVPIPVILRRRTKTFIDSVVDSIGEGCGAAVVFLWVTLPNLPSRYLSLFVIMLSVLFVILSRRMGKEYFSTIVDRLKKEEARAEKLKEGAMIRKGNLLSASLTHLDVQALMTEVRVQTPELASGSELRMQSRDLGPGAEVRTQIPDLEAGTEGAERDQVVIPGSARSRGAAAPADAAGPTTPADVLSQLESPNARTVLAGIEQLASSRGWCDESHYAALARLLARDAVYRQAGKALADLGQQAVPYLVRKLRDPETDFVIRRRMPAVLAEVRAEEADDALLDALVADRFEIRYRAAIALRRRRKRGFPQSRRDCMSVVWAAIEAEVKRDRPVWELQRLLDASDSTGDGLVIERVGVRGELSLEHTFRMMTLILDPEPVRAAFHGIILKNKNLEGFALEYLEQVLPDHVRNRLWVFIGDISERRRKEKLRPLDRVVSDLMSTRATLFAGEKDREALRRLLKNHGA